MPQREREREATRRKLSKNKKYIKEATQEEILKPFSL